MKPIHNVKLLYAIRFFQNLIPAYVIERLFWEQRGMSVQEVVYTEIIYAATIMMLEVPTGILADKWSRKNLLLFSALLGCGEFLILLFSTEFWHFAAVVFLAGAAGSAASGSENALLYDSLLQHGQEGSFEKTVGRLNVWDSTAIILAALSGGFMAGRFGLEFNYWLSLAGASAAFLLSLLLVEPKAKSGSEEAPGTLEYIRTSIRFFLSHPGVCLVVLSGMVTGAALSFHDEFWQLYLDRLHIPVFYFGIFSAVMFLARLPGQLAAYLLAERFSFRTLLSAVTAVFAAGFLYASAIHGISSLAAIVILCLFSGIMEPLAAGYLHHRVDSSMRATMDSFRSLGFYVVLSLAGLGFGYFSDRFDIFGGYGFLGLVCGLFLLWFWFASRSILNR